MRYPVYILITALITGCAGPAPHTTPTGGQLARTYCASCHLFPDPALLDKTTWKENVLPAMAKQLGIDHIFETPLPNQTPAITIQEWKDILAYYVKAAPDSMPRQSREPVTSFTDQFISQTFPVGQYTFPSTSFIKIDPGNHRIYAASAADSALNIYDARLKLLSHTTLHGAIVDMDFNEPLTQPGPRTGVLTNIGIMNPNDGKSGSADDFKIDTGRETATATRRFDSLTRPVQITKYDLDKDGRQDYLVCAFGNTRGALYWLQATATGGFEKKSLLNLPGALKCWVEDINNDGLADVLALMAQAQERVCLFLNKGNGQFEMHQLLEFPPVFGSSYIDWVDFNKDGFKDIIYTCGDNGDYSTRALKNYHGVYVYLNDGKNDFTQRYFFPIHGCYKALARDFDKDGDLDIAAISFFPDEKNQPQESFVYLEQTSAFQFKAFSVQAFSEGRWMTMDAGDLDGDGYDDIVLGSLVPPYPAMISQWKSSHAQKAAILVLHNKGKAQ